MDGDSSIRAVSGSTLQGFGLVLDFSSLVLSADSTLDGPLFCYSGGDAFCGDPTQVTGDSTCGQCMLP